MKQVTISSSLKFKEYIIQTIADLHKLGIVGLFPNLDNHVKKEEVGIELLKKIEAEHFKSIDVSEGLYVICPEGYVGTLVSLEIGYAHAQGKPVYFSEIPGDLGLQAIATGYISANQLVQFKEL